MKNLFTITIAVLLVLTAGTNLFAQSGESDLNIYGYYQTWAQQSTEADGMFIQQPTQNSFVMQQLNLFLQKDIAAKWSSFVNFEFINSTSTERKWGDINLEEAWARYKKSDAFTLKIGLLIPEFNNLNKIKNRTPLLPYILRPTAYESTLGTRIDLEALTPQRAFVEASGTIDAGKAKLDYAAYIGNSPNIAQKIDIADGDNDVSASDTTNTVLFGGRIGMRYKDVKFGVSGIWFFVQSQFSCENKMRI